MAMRNLLFFIILFGEFSFPDSRFDFSKPYEIMFSLLIMEARTGIGCLSSKDLSFFPTK